MFASKASLLLLVTQRDRNICQSDKDPPISTLLLQFLKKSKKFSEFFNSIILTFYCFSLAFDSISRKIMKMRPRYCIPFPMIHTSLMPAITSVRNVFLVNHATFRQKLMNSVRLENSFEDH